MKLSAGVLLEQATNYLQKMDNTLKPINEALIDLLNDESASIQFQYSDGWVILFEDEANAKIKSNEIDHLLSLSKEQALDFLHARTI